MTSPVITLGTVTLPPDLDWVDRYSWQPVSLETRRTIGGVLRFAAGTLGGGRTINLASYDDGAAFSDQDVSDLVAMASIPGAEYILSWDGETHTVIFDSSDGPAVSFVPMADKAPWWGYWRGEIKLIEVA